MRLIIDVSSLLWQSLLAGVDGEFGRKVEFQGKEVQVNSWHHGYECALAHLQLVMRETGVVPIDMVFVVEGKMSKAKRKAIYNGYKDGRDSRPQEAYDEFHKAKEAIVKAFRDVGAQIVTQDGVEADDVIAYLVRHLTGQKIILTRDGDLTTLIDQDVMLYQGGKLTSENKYGPFPCRFTPVYKALVGDGEEYKGAVGFGQKAFLDFLVWAGEPGLAAIEGLMKRRALHELGDDVAEFKPARKIIDGAKHVYESYECALLHDEWVNTLRQPLVWSAGMVRGRDVVVDDRLRPYAQSTRLITSDNYDEAYAFFKKCIDESPIFSLDIETSTPEESDDWLASGDRDEKVDVFGSELTGMGLTFGRNNNLTFYFSVDHADTKNVTSEQVRRIVELIPPSKPIVIQNFAFEGPILYGEWGTALKNNGWHGFLPNVIDTAICASYVDENIPQGLKQSSKHYLDYDQATYQSVTTLIGLPGELPPGGRLLSTGEDGSVTKQYKMRDLPAQHVLSYGADDTICTAALFNHYRLRMELENTWDVMLEVEQLPAYVCALAFHQGTRFGLAKMHEIEQEDQATYDQCWAELSRFLVAKGWEGTVTPVIKELTPANVKETVRIILGQELVTQVRTVSKLAKLVEVMDHDDAPLLAKFITEGAIDHINDMVASKFSGEPVFDLDSPKQMKKFLYDTLGLPVHLVNSTTPTERRNNPLLARIISDHKKRWAGHETRPIEASLFTAYCVSAGLPFPCDTGEVERNLLKSKAKTDEKAIAFALLLDCPEGSENARILGIIQAMKKCATRKKMFYKPYANLRHWKDGKIHGQAGQTRTVTRRFAPSEPNLAQLPKKGEGVKFRECFLPHHREAVMCSIDFAGQELRQGAAQSGDPNMLACFVGDNLKDMHSLTAAGAMQTKWGKAKVAELIERFGQEGDDDYALFLRLRKCPDDPSVAKLADDLRKNAKNVNFGAQYDAQAPKLAETLIIPVTDAETFLQAKYAMFPRFEVWKDEVKDEVSRMGYVCTPMGARRHLRDAILSDEWGAADKALRQGPNFKIQGGSAEQTKLAMARLWRSGILFRLDMVFFAPIHDELVFSVHRDHAVECLKTVNWCMTQPYGGLAVPFIGSISLGPTFGKQYECGDWVIEENIRSAIDKVFTVESAAA